MSRIIKRTQVHRATVVQVDYYRLDDAAAAEFDAAGDTYEREEVAMAAAYLTEEPLEVDKLSETIEVTLDEITDPAEVARLEREAQR